MKYDSVNNTQEQMEPHEVKVALLVPKQLVKTVKTLLERCGRLDRSANIVLHIRAPDEECNDMETGDKPSEVVKTPDEQRMRIPTSIPYPLDGEGFDPPLPDQDTNSYKLKLLQELDLTPYHNDIEISHYTSSTTATSSQQKNPLHRALQEALNNLPDEILARIKLTTKSLIDSFPESYSIYKPMLLLPHNAFASPQWTSFFALYPITHPLLQSIWEYLAKATGTTHIAINSPIPLQSNHENENILRSPVNITPFYGDFGPVPTPQTLSHPLPSDYDTALWVSTTQNGIHQTWAPLYTMFSRGNIREKTRILRLANMSFHATAVDMYAGIGYFSFSYKKAGIGKVVCFELNPWSIEGLRRGAERNHWSYKIVKEDEDAVADVDLLIFQMSNEHAFSIVSRLRSGIPPVQHVNLGLLPDARAAWRDAVLLVDRREGGCVRVHENVGVNEIEDRIAEVERTCQRYLDECMAVEKETGQEYQCGRTLRVEHVERVKMYAPGVVHCVFDIRVQGIRDM